MELIKFEDTCRIMRNVKNEDGDVIYDEYDEPTSAVVYEGACCYLKGGQTSLSIVTRNDQVYLPDSGLGIELGDIISATTKIGREYQGVIGNVRDIEMPISRELYTKLEIKQATGQ